jgi:hypothetical protein
MNAVVQAVPEAERSLAGPNVLLLGEGGTGKTYSLGTLADWCQSHGKEMFVLFTENSLETLLGYWRDKGVDVPACLHWHQSLTKGVGLKQILEGAKRVGEMSYETLTKTVDNNRSGENNAFWKILSTCSDFRDDRTGKSFGPVDAFGMDKVFCLDSFTELGNAAAKMVIGSKPTMAPPEYGVAQNNVMNFIRLCTQGISCTFVMTAHPSREKDEISGAVKTSVSTGGIGTAIIPQIPPLFSDMIWCVREGNKFNWDTAAYGVTTKTRSLGYKANIEPNFAPLMDLWQKRGGK